MMNSLPEKPASVQVLPATSATIAVDSEFYQTETLTVQVAARIDPETIAIQVYRSADVPDLPETFDLNTYLPITEEGYGKYCKGIYLRPVKLLTPDLSP